MKDETHFKTNLGIISEESGVLLLQISSGIGDEHVDPGDAVPDEETGAVRLQSR